MRRVPSYRPVFFSLLLVLLISTSFNLTLGQNPLPSSAVSQQQKPTANARPISAMTPADPVCELLMKQYILVSGKIATDDVQAAIHLVGSRGRAHGYWRIVLNEFEKSFGDTQRNRTIRRNTLAVLNQMLTYEGWARWNQRHATPPVASPIGSYLGPEVLDRIIARSAQADSSEIDAFVLAVRHAYDSRGIPFLLGILKSPQAGGSWHDARFHAAVALAELEVGEGVEWLIAHTNADGGENYIFRVPHRQVTGGEESKCCKAALADLSGHQQALQSQAEWQQWWAINRDRFRPAGLVNLKTR